MIMRLQFVFGPDNTDKIPFSFILTNNSVRFSRFWTRSFSNFNLIFSLLSSVLYDCLAAYSQAVLMKFAYPRPRHYNKYL